MPSPLSHLEQRIKGNPRDRVGIFREIAPNEQGFVLLNLPRRYQRQILVGLDLEEIIRLVHFLDPNDATDLLQQADSKQSKRVVEALNTDLKDKVEFLLRFHPQTAAGMMSLDYIEVPLDSTLDEVSASVKDHEARTGKFPAILAVEKGLLAGEVPGHVFALAKETDEVKDHVKSTPHISYGADEREVRALFRSHPHSKVVVLDEDDSIMGVIYADDMLRIIGRQRSGELYNFAGLRDEEDILDSALTKVRHRYRWLLLNLATAFLAASVVSLFEDTISKFVLLAVYMPIVAGMGGNAGTQTLAVTVRGLALKELELKGSARVIVNEMLAGAANGAVNGVLVALIASFWNQSPLLGLVLAIAMVVNLIIAGLFGALIPLFLQKVGKDPASSATIFITTATDVFGFFVFLGLATLVL